MPSRKNAKGAPGSRRTARNSSRSHRTPTSPSRPAKARSSSKPSPKRSQPPAASPSPSLKAPRHPSSPPLEASTSLPERILHRLKQNKDRAWNIAELARDLQLTERDRQQLVTTLKALETDGLVARIKQDHWVLPAVAGLVPGVIQFNQKGFAFLIAQDGGPDVFIPAEDTGTALHQDLVLVRLNLADRRSRSDPNRRTGTVIRILKRRHRDLVGTLSRVGQFFVVVPDDPRFVHDLYVPEPGSIPDSPQAQPGDKVVARLTRWDNRHVNPEGVITERLGLPGDPGVDILSIIRKHQIPTEFPPEALAEVSRFPNPNASVPVTPDRQDFTGDLVITIDPDTAKDFDDAISLHPGPRGNTIVGIHIADVSHYVTPGSALDREAGQRGNSVYLVNQVIPMLPEELSNGLCSLVPHLNRYTVTVLAEITPEGHIASTRFVRSVIHSKHRLTYHQALARLQKPPTDDLDHFLHRAWKLASTLRRRRFQQGALDLDFPEIKVHCDSSGRPIRLEKITNDISHQLIEEFMLLANECVAAHLKSRQIPSLYRVHESPDPSKLLEYRELLLAHKVKVGDLTRREELQKALKAIAGLPEYYALKVGLLKSLKRANYQPKPLGHYGLAKTNYTHFTSPIRRYADLIVHRSLFASKQERRDLLPEPLARIGEHLSQTERTAAEAEQESVRLKKLEFFSYQLQSGTAQTFDAVVTEVQNFGFFIELPDFLITGLVHLSTLKDDFYLFDPRRLRLEGRRSKRRIAVGDQLRVQVERLDLFKKQIDFRLAQT
ncbi:MAG: ribonuclease R [Verrucomicrobiia bacterium]